MHLWWWWIESNRIEICVNVDIYEPATRHDSLIHSIQCEVSVCNGSVLCTHVQCAYCMGLAIQANEFSVEIQCTLWFIFTVCRLHVDWIKFNENCPLIIHFHWNLLVFFFFFYFIFNWTTTNVPLSIDSFASMVCELFIHCMHALHCIALSVSQSVSRVVIGHLIFYNKVSWYFIWLLLSLDRFSAKIIISIIIIIIMQLQTHQSSAHQSTVY